MASASQSLDLLNTMQAKIIEFANNEGILLSDNFASVDEFKKFVIGLTFRMLVDMGIEVKEAFDMVLGDGSFDALAERIWESAQSTS